MRVARRTAAASSGSWASPWASVVRCGSRSRTASAAASAARRLREQPEGAAVGGVDQLDDLVELRLRRARRGRAAAGAGRRTGSPAGRSRTGCRRRGRATAARRRRARRSVEPSTTRSVGLSPTLVATAAKSPPSISVARVKTTVLSVSSLSRIGPHTWSGATQSCGGSRSPPSVSQSTSVSSVGGHPLGGREHLLHRALGLGAAGVGLAARVALGVRREAGPGGVAHQRPARRRAPRARVSIRPGRASSIARAQRVAGVGEVVGLVALDVPLRPPGGPLDLGRGQLVGGGLGDPGDQLVGLVDHHDVVLRDHRHALDRVDREQRVVGDDQVGAVRLLAGPLGEALLRRTGTSRRPGTRGG